jgi:hypothetical protein
MQRWINQVFYAGKYCIRLPTPQKKQLPVSHCQRVTVMILCDFMPKVELSLNPYTLFRRFPRNASLSNPGFSSRMKNESRIDFSLAYTIISGTEYKGFNFNLGIYLCGQVLGWE